MQDMPKYLDIRLDLDDEMIETMLRLTADEPDADIASAIMSAICLADAVRNAHASGYALIQRAPDGTEAVLSPYTTSQTRH